MTNLFQFYFPGSARNVSRIASHVRPASLVETSNRKGRYESHAVPVLMGFIEQFFFYIKFSRGQPKMY